VTLVALCFTAVMGITLAGYIAVCSRAMNLSNRSFQNNLSKQLAEAGLDEALRAYNKNDWSHWASNPTNVTAGAWTLDTTNKRATRTITFDTGKLGQGITGTIKLRIDNYDANQLDSVWNSTTNYRINDLVGYNGIWYRCIQNHSNQTPGNLAYWAQAPIPWAWSSNTAYVTNTGTTNNSVIFDGSTWYYCNTSHTSGNTSTFSADSANTSKWTAMDPPTFAWTSSTSYTVNQQVYNTIDDKWYRCKTAHTSTSSFNSGNFDQGTVVIAWRWQSSHIYSFNQVVYYNQTWYRCIVSSSTGNTPGVSSDWENALTGMYAWSSSLSYNIGDTVNSGSSRYRCIQANSNKTPASNAAYWSAYPNFSRDWDSGRQYSQYDSVRYNGVRYLSLQNSNYGQNPVTATTYWVGSNTSTASYQWNATTAYAAGDYKCYGGVWYKCTTANTGQSPNNTTYWTSTWAQGSGVTTGSTVVYAEGTIAIAGSPSITTQLRATVASAPLFPNAVAATTSISANSGGTVDSYNSVTGTYASQVNTSTNYSAVVAAGYTSGTAITLSTTAVKGYVAAPSSSTSPYAPLFSSGGSVKGSTSPASPNIDLTRVSRSPYIPQFDTLPGGAGGLAANWATVPKGTVLPTTGTTISIGNPGATTPSRYYYNGNYTIGTASLQYLKIIGPVILYINGDLFITAAGSTGRIDITSTGSAEIHVAGTFKADIGGEGIQNFTADPRKLIIISDTTSTATHFYSEGVYPLIGVVYIPYSTSNTGYYNDNTNTNVYGAISANKITYSGANLNVHYDTQLRYATFGGVDQPYTVSEWRELPVTEQATMP